MILYRLIHSKRGAERKAIQAKRSQSSKEKETKNRHTSLGSARCLFSSPPSRRQNRWQINSQGPPLYPCHPSRSRILSVIVVSPLYRSAVIDMINNHTHCMHKTCVSSSKSLPACRSFFSFLFLSFGVSVWPHNDTLTDVVRQNLGHPSAHLDRLACVYFFFLFLSFVLTLFQPGSFFLPVLKYLVIQDTTVGRKASIVGFRVSSQDPGVIKDRVGRVLRCCLIDLGETPDRCRSSRRIVGSRKGKPVMVEGRRIGMFSFSEVK